MRRPSVRLRRPARPGAVVASCVAVREAVSARLDGEAPPLADGPVDTHLRTCASCSEFAARSATLRARLALRVPRGAPAALGTRLRTCSPEPVDPPAALRRQLRRSSRSPGRRRARPLALSLAGLAAAAGLAVGLPVHTRIRAEEPVTPCTLRLREQAGYPFLPRT